MTQPADALVEVRVVGMSLESYRESSAHHDALFREFALVLARPPSPGHEIPAQLLALIERLNARFSSFTASPTAELQAALSRGEETIDLVYHVPPDVKAGAAELAELLAHADEYCKQGDLLTVAPPPDAVLFRDWFLAEFVNQVDGLPPTTWTDFLEQSK